MVAWDSGISILSILPSQQSWRLLTQPHSLFYRVVKAKYFPRHSFLHAQLGSKPSFFQLSVMAAQPLIRDGILWKVGNGRNINIWTDPWLPTNLIRRADIISFDTVDQLIDPDLRSWNLHLLEQLFTNREISQIVSIPLGSTSRPNLLESVTLFGHMWPNPIMIRTSIADLTRSLG